MNVYDQAHGLAQAIKASEEYKQYDQAKKKIKDNEELENMIKDFQSKQFEMQAKQLSGGQLTPEDMAGVQQLYAILLKRSSGRPVILEAEMLLFPDDERCI